jgi:hypothetical protein
MWWSTLFLFGTCWVASVFLLVLHRLATRRAPAGVPPAHATEPDGALLDDSASGAKQLRRHPLRTDDMWWRLSSYLASLNDAKNSRDKAIEGLYRRFVSEAHRAASPIEEGNEGMIIAVVKLRFWVQYLSIRAAFVLFFVPIGMMLLLNSHLWIPWLARGQWDLGTASQGVSVNMRDTTLYEWHDVAGVRRAVPYCTQYDKAGAIYEEEVRLLLQRDMLKDESRHARCVLRKTPEAKHVWPIAADIAKELQALVNRRAISNVTLPGLSGTEMTPPFLYVLRDGERYIRLTVRSDDDTHFEPRMVRLADLKSVLSTWQKDVAKGALNAQIHYCMCPAFLGVLDNVTFFLNTATNDWEIWLQPRISYVNPLSAVDAPRRMRYSKEIAPLPYHQNQQILENAADPSGQNHMFQGFDTIRVQFADPTTVKLPDDLEALERFWMGHGTLRRVHEESNPFALAVPLASDRFASERLITGADTVCYMHCQHLLDVVLSSR